VNWFEDNINRRDFLKFGSLIAGSAFLAPWTKWSKYQIDFPDAERLGRICVGKVDLRASPSVDAASVGALYEDGVIVWLREVIGEAPGLALCRRWVETPDGYVYAPSVQPVKNSPNPIVTSLRDTSMGQGMWVEVTVPYVDLILENPPARSPWLKNTTTPRLYYSQVMWVDQIKTDESGNVWYRVNEQYGTYGDIFWAAAAAFRPITEEELTPIHPEVENKKVVVDVNHQVLSCYEGNDEVYYCRISSGAKFNAEGEEVENWATPLGSYWIWRKLYSIHMAGGTVSGGYDLPGIAWTSLFMGEGVAIHSTFWHNDYGTPRSHGCVNASPEDAKWVFRWTIPHVPYDPGDLVDQSFKSTTINVIEA
jgi:lipoprotein-anchoring transpeptidase ErfK/SrfK